MNEEKQEEKAIKQWWSGDLVEGFRAILSNIDSIRVCLRDVKLVDSFFLSKEFWDDMMSWLQDAELKCLDFLHALDREKKK